MTADAVQLRALREQAFAQAHPVLFDQLRSYAGKNAFVLQMIRKLNEWGGLTEGQAIACNRMLASARIHEDQDTDPRGDWPSDSETKSEHMGTLGERLHHQLVRVVFCRLIRQPEFPRGALYLVKLDTLAGNQLTWFTEKKTEPFDGFHGADFTVKEHATYRGSKYTKVTRVNFNRT